MSIKKMMFHLLTQMLSSYRKYILYRTSYSNKALRAINENKMVICMFDGKCYHGGIADRVKGILSTYMVAKEMGIDFKIYFCHPFPIEKIYLPKDVSWIINANEISYNTKDVKFCQVLNNHSLHNDIEAFKKVLQGEYKQLHIYSNSSLCQKMGKFSQLYHELFILSDSFKADIQPYLDKLGANYICLGARFAGALGDFNDIVVKSLSSAQKEELLNKAVNLLRNVHKRYPESKIFIATDSSKFMSATSKFDYVISLNQKKVNMSKDDEQNFDVLKRSFIDFILVSESSRIIQIKGEGMYLGGFLESGSYVNNTPYEILNF